MKCSVLFLIIFFCSTRLWGQVYERNTICGRDTIQMDHRSLKTGESIQYRAVECAKVSKLGIRLDVGFNHYNYNSKTQNWLGDHNGPFFGLTISYRDFNIGVKFKPATINPGQDLTFNGETLTADAKLNPNKIDYDISYSINFKHNVSIEPYIALTAHRFIVINEEQLGKNYDISNVKGLTMGTAINKYFQLKGYQFFSIFARYGYGLTNFKKVNASLGTGYSDLAIGIAYKGFIRQRFFKRV
jgi:hypothetical protein